MDESEPRPPSPSQLSKILSWISLGFVLGALFVWALPAPEVEAPASASATAPAAEPPPVLTVPVRSGPAPLSDIEAVFEVWGHHAIWYNDLSEVALWDTETKQFSRFYEVIRNGDTYYFRTIDRLTRPILTHGIRVDGPLLYTETEAMRDEWLREKHEEDWRIIKESNPLAPTTPPVIPVSPTPTPSTEYRYRAPRVTTGDGR